MNDEERYKILADELARVMHLPLETVISALASGDRASLAVMDAKVEALEALDYDTLATEYEERFGTDRNGIILDHAESDTTMIFCAWCGAAMSGDQGGSCVDCKHHTCIACKARVVCLDGAEGPMASSAVAHMDTVLCPWADHWGWHHMPRTYVKPGDRVLYYISWSDVADPCEVIAIFSLTHAIVDFHVVPSVSHTVPQSSLHLQP